MASNGNSYMDNLFEITVLCGLIANLSINKI